MTTTNLLGLPLLEAAQAQKHVTHNEALLLIDALVQLTVLDRDLAAPPATPAEGERYIVAAGASGEWAGQDLKLAVFVDGVWRYLAPAPGWRAWIADEQRLLAWDGTQWRDFADLTGYLGAASLADGTVNQVGVNGAADTTNRLAVKSDAVLFSHDDVTPGNGDMRTTLNKSAAVGTASVLFQSGWSGRAEFGLAGSDDFSVKVSADGTAWNEAMKISGATARISGIAFDATGTTAQSLPIGTTAQRPGTPALGQIRYNSTDNKVEYYNGSTWVQLEAGAGAGREGGRLEYVSATSIKFAPKNGDRVKIAGIVYAIPSSGITAASTSVLVNGVTGNLAANTTYLVSLYSNSGTPTVAFWSLATGHTADTTAGNVGVEVISGNADHTLIGMIRTNGTSQFVSSASQRLVISWFNRRGVFGRNSVSSTTTTSTGFVAIGSIQVDLLCWGDDAVSMSIGCSAQNSAGAVLYSTNLIDGTAVGPRGDATIGANVLVPHSLTHRTQLVEGYHYHQIGGAVSSGVGTYTYAEINIASRG